MISIVQDRIYHSDAACDSPKVHEASVDQLHSQGMRRRAADGPPDSIDHNVCSIFLDADATFFEQWGGVGTEVVRMMKAT